ncbi:hypothetical protein E2562_014659 [Oryza meyeriana var. granulata]|uniref:Uncharacterized protein n=1 Tax=Oryza meyeriana var. granulata TaxID=110450 RepID=A0A6G1D5M8_9ORYZ|nr:hypothetical protein E2562_014659 [Oryza meyeriana var. granulata]
MKLFKIVDPCGSVDGDEANVEIVDLCTKADGEEVMDIVNVVELAKAVVVVEVAVVSEGH